MRKPLKARALSVFLWCRQHAAKSHVSRRKGERLDEERSRNQAVRASMGGGLGRGGREKDGQVSSDSVVRGLARSEEHTSELQSRRDLVCRLLLEKKKKQKKEVRLKRTNN